MHIGNLTLIIPALYLIAAAVVVLILGVIAAANPKGKVEHYFSAHYLAPCLMIPALVLAGGVIYLALGLAGRTSSVMLAGRMVGAPAAGLFVTSQGAQLVVDPFAAILSFIAIAGTLIVMLLSIDHFGEFQTHKSEYYALLMFATAAASLAAAASDLIAVYLSIEFLSLVSYVLAAYTKTDRRSGEAGLKYFLYGAACSAIMLYGMSILFGVTGGNTSFAAVARHFNMASPETALGAAASGAGWVAVVFILAGLGFKLALVPFQFWAPDVYEGAPTPITAFLSIVSKAAGLAVLVRFLLVIANPAGTPSALSWYWILVVLTGLSMLWGNLVAIWQTNIKRMLAYSSIAQVGYMMVGVLAEMHVFLRGNMDGGGAVRAIFGGSLPWGLQGVIVFLTAYLLMNLGAFAVVVAVGKRLGSDAIQSYAGLMKRSPLYAAALTVFFASLAGIPPTAGFLGKFLVFGSAVKVGILGHWELIILAALGVVNSVISVYYYFNVVRLMFFAPPSPAVLPESEGKQLRGSLAVTSAIVATLILTLGLIVLAKPVSDLASKAVYSQASSGASVVANQSNGDIDLVQRHR